jgi:hypothetical protein
MVAGQNKKDPAADLLLCKVRATGLICRAVFSEGMVPSESLMLKGNHSIPSNMTLPVGGVYCGFSSAECRSLPGTSFRFDTRVVRVQVVDSSSVYLSRV